MSTQDTDRTVRSTRQVGHKSIPCDDYATHLQDWMDVNCGGPPR
ncbi:hypothetical protein [Actinomadura rugatobispora]|uniref:Uncharacterized protein n=1 Tax=Actinomadura rugatobispora TaxID=1994 RepID=A0ABW1A231_9ACTN